MHQQHRYIKSCSLLYGWTVEVPLQDGLSLGLSPGEKSLISFLIYQIYA